MSSDNKQVLRMQAIAAFEDMYCWDWLHKKAMEMDKEDLHDILYYFVEVVYNFSPSECTPMRNKIIRGLKSRWKM